MGRPGVAGEVEGGAGLAPGGGGGLLLIRDGQSRGAPGVIPRSG